MLGPQDRQCARREEIRSFRTGAMNLGVGGSLHARKAAEQPERADDTDPHSQLLHIVGWFRDRRGPGTRCALRSRRPSAARVDDRHPLRCPDLGRTGGTSGVDDAFAQQHEPGIGAEIMGANKFGPPGWQDDGDWKGWWGPNPPFHTPTFVLTHRPRPSIEMEGGTTFHFLDAAPAEALDAAREAAGGQDVRIGGGATVVRDFLAGGLIDHM